MASMRFVCVLLAFVVVHGYDYKTLTMPSELSPKHGKPTLSAHNKTTTYDYKHLRPFVVGNNDNAYGRTDVLFSLDISGHFEPSGDGKVTYSGENIPCGLRLTADGVMVGIPVAPGNYTVKISASDESEEIIETNEFVVGINPYGVPEWDAICNEGCFDGTSGKCQVATQGDNRCMFPDANGQCNQGFVDCSIELPTMVSSVILVTVVTKMDYEGFIASSEQQEAMAGAITAAAGVDQAIVTDIELVEVEVEAADADADVDGPVEVPQVTLSFILVVETAIPEDPATAVPVDLTGVSAVVNAATFGAAIVAQLPADTTYLGDEWDVKSYVEQLAGITSATCEETVVV